MDHLKLIGTFFKTSAQAEMAYRANFFIRLLNAVLGVVTGVLSLSVIFNQVDTLKGWDFPSALALLGVYLLLGALRSLFIGPSLESVAGMDGEVWQGTFDFTLLKPVNKQFLVSVRHWRVLSLVDVVFALVVLGIALSRLGATLTWGAALQFSLALVCAVALLYAALLAFSALVFLNPGFLFTWVINDLFQLARYPVGLYPGWLRLILTWVIPVGLMTTIPAQALSGTLQPGMLALTVVFTIAAVAGASWLFRRGLRRYSSASS
ncbi:ABC-2 family transporter protein [bacterium]|nr:ABC-2 family transporter protein [bacterium]